MSCTECGRKGGCEAHKGGMFAAIDETLRRLYPTRRWAERDDEAGFGAGVTPDEGAALAGAMATRLKALAVHCPGKPDEICDYVYVLCVGRPPSLIEIREQLVEAPEEVDGVHELYLRVALSSVARMAVVQEVAVHAERYGRTQGIVEAPRTGVFDPVLLKRFRSLVAVLAEHDVRHLDFGDILEPPSGFDPGDYAARYGASPGVANYLFYPQPPGAVMTTFLPTAFLPPAI